MQAVRLPTIAPRPPRWRSRTQAQAATPAVPAPPAPPPHRAVVRPKALIDAINRDIGARSECVGLTVDVGRWEIAHRSGDCNWSEASLVVRVTGAVSPAAFVELRKAIARAQLRYDVFAPEAYLR